MVVPAVVTQTAYDGRRVAISQVDLDPANIHSVQACIDVEAGDSGMLVFVKLFLAWELEISLKLQVVISARHWELI